MNWSNLCICCTFKEWFFVYCTVFSRISRKCRNFCDLRAYFTKWEISCDYRIKTQILHNILWTLKKDIADGCSQHRAGKQSIDAGNFHFPVFLSCPCWASVEVLLDTGNCCAEPLRTFTAHSCLVYSTIQQVLLSIWGSGYVLHLILLLVLTISSAESAKWIWYIAMYLFI